VVQAQRWWHGLGRVLYHPLAPYLPAARVTGWEPAGKEGLERCEPSPAPDFKAR